MNRQKHPDKPHKISYIIMLICIMQQVNLLQLLSLKNQQSSIPVWQTLLGFPLNQNYARLLRLLEHFFSGFLYTHSPGLLLYQIHQMLMLGQDFAVLKQKAPPVFNTLQHQQVVKINYTILTSNKNNISFPQRH